MNRVTAFVLTGVLLVLLAASVFGQAWVVPSIVRGLVAEYPVVGPLAIPGTVWGVLAIACWQGVGVSGLRMVALGRRYGFDTAGRRWMLVMIGCLLAFDVLVVAAVVGLDRMGYSSPASIELIFAGVVALGLAGSLGLVLGTRLTPIPKHQPLT